MNKNKRIVATILTAATLGSSLTLSFADSKSNSQKTKEEMSAIKNEKANISDKSEILNVEINKKTQKLNETKERLETTLDRKIKNEELLQKIEKDLKKGVSQLKEHFSTYYMNSYTADSTMLETFIKSESISDYIVTSNHLKFVVEDKDKKVEDVKELLEKQKQTIAEIKKDEDNLMNLQNSLNNEMGKLQKTKQEYDSEMSSLNQKYNQLEDILIIQQEEEDRIKKEILAAQQKPEKKENEEEKNNETTTNKAEASSASESSDGWKSPLKSYTAITSLFGPRTHPITGKYTNHGGMDIAAPMGTSVHSSKSGKVITSQYSGSYGNYIIIDHGDGLATLYAHLSERSVSVGTNVSGGQVIGKVGSTGRSTGPHLHLELRKNGERIDPQSKINI